MFRSLHWMALLVALGWASNARALPLISEVLYDASGSDNGAVFIEIYGMAGTRLDGFSIEGVNGSNGSVGPVVLLSGSIPSNGFFVVADDRGDGQSDVPAADWIANFDFQNGPDSVVLRDAMGILDAVGYGVFSGGAVFAGEGTPTSDSPAGSSIARWFADVDSGDNSFDFGVLAAPTPGTAALQVPEPSTGALFVVALAGIAQLGRRRSPEGAV